MNIKKKLNIEKETERERHTQTDRERGRHTDRQTERERGRHTDRQSIYWRHYLCASRCTQARVRKVSGAGGAGTVALTGDQWQEPEQKH